MLVDKTEWYKETSVSLHWQAAYEDGTVLNQYNEDATKNSYNDLNRDGLETFSLLDDQDNVIVTVELEPNCVLFWRMRVALHPSGRTRERVHLVGWRKADGTEEINLVLQDGKVRKYKKWNPNSQWLYEPIWRSQEIP